MKIEHFHLLHLNTYQWGFVIAVVLLVYELKLCGLMCPVTRCSSLLCDFPTVFIYIRIHGSSPPKKLAKSWGNSKNCVEYTPPWIPKWFSELTVPFHIALNYTHLRLKLSVTASLSMCFRTFGTIYSEKVGLFGEWNCKRYIIHYRTDCSNDLALV